MSDKQIDMFSSNDGQAEVAVHFTEDAAWLSQGQMVELFGKAKKTCIRIARCKIFFSKFLNQKLKAGSIYRLLDLTGLPRGRFAVMSFVVIINPLAEGDPV